MKRKHQINWYQANDIAAMERKLEKMAQRGWFLEKLTNWGFKYVRSEPQAVRYSITYFPGASVFDPRLSDEQMTYADYCQAAGWELVSSWGPLQIFRSTRPDPIPIETDEEAKLQAIHKSMLKTSVLSYALLLVVWVMNLALRLGSLGKTPLDFLASNHQMAFTGFLLFFILYMAYMLADYFWWYFQSKKRVERGEDCAQPHTRLRYALSMVLLAMCAVMLLSQVAEMSSSGDVLLYAIIFAGLALVMVLSQQLMKLMKRKGFSRKVTRAVFVVSVVAMSFAYTSGIMAAVLRMGDHDLFAQRQPVEVYTDSRGHEWEIYADELPITLEDLGYTVTPEDRCTYLAEPEQSVLLSKVIYLQRGYGESSQLPELNYGVVTARWDWVLDWCWDLIYEEGRDVRNEQWGALGAFVKGYPYGYCLRFEDKIILVDQSMKPTEADFAAVIEALK